MNILLTSCGSTLGKVLAAELGAPFHLRLTDRALDHSASAGRDEIVVSPLGHDGSTDLLVSGMDGVVHVVEPLDDETPESYLDYATRLTYNLLIAAHAQQVKRVVLLSTLDLLSQYDEAYQVTERWRPRPTTQHDVMGKYLAEHVAREFAREHKLTVVTLRIGHLINPRRIGAEKTVDPLWLRNDDFVAAVSRAFLAELPFWSVFHVQSRFPGARFVTQDAERSLGFVSTLELPTQV